MARRLLGVLALAVLASLAARTASADDSRQIATAVAQPAPTPFDFKPERFHVRDGRIYADDREIPLFGINWSGLETEDRALHGLWEGRSVGDFMRQISVAGFTAVRLPITPEMLDRKHKVADWAIDKGYGPTGLDMLNQAVDAAERAGLWVLLSFNSYDSAIKGGDTPAPYHHNGSYKVADWLNDLKRMAEFALDRPEIVGIDLFNEPYGISWKEWKTLAEKGGERVLKTNRRLLIFVEGVGETRTETGGYGAFWGSNFTEAAKNPIDLKKIPADKLVYSPHVYGPDVYMMPYFNAPDYPTNMYRIWDLHFGHLTTKHAVCAGEFGGKYLNGTPDALWHDALVTYMTHRGAMASCWFYWQFNPNSTDTGGVLSEDWRSFDPRKIAMLGRLKQAR